MWTADTIRKLRKRYGETQEQFSAHFRLGWETIRKWEAGQEPSGPATVILDLLLDEINERQGSLTEPRQFQSA